MRAIWKGAISFGLVTIPIKVYPAIKKEKISFTSLCPHCKQPIKHKRWCPHCNKEVGYEELLKGYKIAKDKYVILTKKDLEGIKLKTTKCIEIYEFVDLNQIDPIYFETAYYIVPDELGIKAYSLFAEALRLSNKAAIGKVVMRNKEYVVLLRAYKKGIAMHILHYLGEVRNIEELEEIKGLVTLTEQEINLALALIEKMSSKELDLSRYKDRYTEMLKELIQAKIKGEELVKEEEKEEAKAADLMDALKQSIQIIEKKKT